MTAPTLLEAAKAILADLNSERADAFGVIGAMDPTLFDALKSAVLHEEDERGDIERLLKLVHGSMWINADGDGERESALEDTTEQIMWRRKARAEQELKR